jgi:hypothetical protein
MTDIPVYCTPIDELEDAKEFSNQIVMPVIGSLSESVQSSQLFNYAMNFVSFFLVLIISYFVVPLIYLYGFAAKIVKHTDIDNLKNNSGSSIPFWIFIILLLLGDILLFSVSSGSNNSNNNDTYYAIIILLMICLSVFIIISKSEKIYNLFDIDFEFGNFGSEYYKPIAGFIGVALLGSLIMLAITGVFPAAIFFIAGSIGYVFGSFLIKDNLVVDE